MVNFSYGKTRRAISEKKIVYALQKRNFFLYMYAVLLCVGPFFLYNYIGTFYGCYYAFTLEYSLIYIPKNNLWRNIMSFQHILFLA